MSQGPELHPAWTPTLPVLAPPTCPPLCLTCMCPPDMQHGEQPATVQRGPGRSPRLDVGCRHLNREPISRWQEVPFEQTLRHGCPRELATAALATRAKPPCPDGMVSSPRAAVRADSTLESPGSTRELPSGAPVLAQSPWQSASPGPAAVTASGGGPGGLPGAHAFPLSSGHSAPPRPLRDPGFPGAEGTAARGASHL